MSVVIRLARGGTSDHPFHMIRVKKKTSSRDGAYIEQIGLYDPTFDPPKVEVNQDRLKYWISVGAIPSETVAGLLQRYVKAPVSA